MLVSPNDQCTPSESQQREEVQRIIREMRKSAADLGPCPTSAWLEKAAHSACQALAEWETPASR